MAKKKKKKWQGRKKDFKSAHFMHTNQQVKKMHIFKDRNYLHNYKHWELQKPVNMDQRICFFSLSKIHIWGCKEDADGFEVYDYEKPSYLRFCLEPIHQEIN